MNTMTPKQYEAAVLIADLVIAQKDNDMSSVQTLVDALNEYSFMNIDNVTLNRLFVPHYCTINEAYYYIVNNLHTIVNPQNLIIQAKIVEIRQSETPVVTLRNVIQEFLDDPTLFNDVTLTMVSSYIGLCLEFQQYNLIPQLRAALNTMANTNAYQTIGENNNE